MKFDDADLIHQDGRFKLELDTLLTNSSLKNRTLISFRNEVFFAVFVLKSNE